MASPAVQLSALAASLPKPAAAIPTKPTTGPFSGGAGDTPGERIINSYNAIQPWAQYSVELGAWAVGYLPWPIGLIAPQMNIGYSGVEPLTRAAVYSLAYAIDGQSELIAPTIKNGIQTSVNNVVQGEAAWIASFFPPLPPIGGGATVVAPRAAARAAASTPLAATVASGAKAAAAAPAPKAAAAETSTAVVSRTAPAATAASSAPSDLGTATADTPAKPAPASRGHRATRVAKGNPGAASSAKASRAGR
jgi:hypothetical protein